MKRYMARDAIGVVQWMEIVPNDEYVTPPPYVVQNIRSGFWVLVQDNLPAVPPEVQEGWQRPDWREVATHLAEALTSTAPKHPALDEFRLALIAHEEAVVPAPPPEAPAGMTDTVPPVESDPDDDEHFDER